MQRYATLLASIAVVGASSTANAGEIYNNLGPGNTFGTSGRIIEGPDVNQSADVDQAARFTTNGKKHSGISVFAGIHVTGPLPFDGTGPLALQIWSDGGGGPTSMLATATLNQGAFGDHLITTTFGSLELDANTNYWVVLDGLTTFDGGWEFNTTGKKGVSAGRSNGGAWNVRNPDVQDLYSLRVVSRAEAVPEPATMAALGLGALGFLKRRKRA